MSTYPVGGFDIEVSASGGLKILLNFTGTVAYYV